MTLTATLTLKDIDQLIAAHLRKEFARNGKEPSVGYVTINVRNPLAVGTLGRMNEAITFTAIITPADKP